MEPQTQSSSLTSAVLPAGQTITDSTSHDPGVSQILYGDLGDPLTDPGTDQGLQPGFKKRIPTDRNSRE